MSKRWGRLCLGICLSLLGLWWATRKVTWASVGSGLAELDWKWVPGMLGCKAVVLVIKDRRWRVELAATGSARLRGTFRAIGLGHFANLVLPFKMGELVRVAMLKRHNAEVAPAVALASIAAERVIDGVVLGAMVLASLFWADVPPWVARGTLWMLLGFSGLAATLAVSPLHRAVIARLSSGRFGRGCAHVVRAVTQGSSVLRSLPQLSKVVGLTAAIWFLETLVLYFVVRAFHLPLGLAEAMVVTLLLSVGLLIPSAPGQIGTHQGLTVFFLTPFAVADADAISASITLQLVSICTLGTIGAFIVLREASARDLLRTARPQPRP